ncbi:MAG: carboxypeptidase-like regulatory domain-containing protein [Bacteroidetes bacterium]|nr:carboxypeptidase-like regulatory domain-containing protein [Bacteroidota bacterium]
MRIKHILITIFLLNSVFVFSQYDYRIFGYITDKKNGEPIVGAQIYLPDWQTETFSNNYGYFSISVPPQDFVIIYSFNGYKKIIDSVYIDQDTQVNIKLSKIKLDETFLDNSRKSQSDLSNPIGGKIDVPISLLKEYPYLLSEPDIIKGLQSLPGITPGNEWGSNLYVRGGGSDQNLMLLDGVPVYNGTHLFGFYSIFQPDITNSIQVYKAGFPARYGGRLSSIVDITTNEGDAKEINGTASMSFLLAKFSIQGPIGSSQNTTFSLGMRRTYYDALSLFAANDQKLKIFKLSDYNFKLKHKISKHDYLIASVYAGRDFWPQIYSDSAKITENYIETKYGNISSVVKWNHIFSPKLFSNISTGFTRYKVTLSEEQKYFDSLNNDYKISDYFYKNGVADAILNGDFEYSHSTKHFFRFGVQSVLHFFNPGYSLQNVDNKAETYESGVKSWQNSIEIASYFEDDYKINNSLKANVGLRSVYYSYKKFNYNPVLIEPRFNLRYILSKTITIKTSYTRMHQTMFLLTNSGIGFPFNFWVSATKNFPVQASDQFNLSIVKEYDKDYQFSVDVFYKTMNNVLYAKENPAFFDNSLDWQSILEKGKAKSYGFEMIIFKKSGYLTGWTGYTLAFADRKFENLNLGKAFPFSFNRRHTINAVLNYRITEKNSIFMNLTLASGRYFTIPGGKFNDIDGNIVLDYTSLNNFKGPIFHRLDIGGIFERQNTERYVDRQIFFTLYNVLLAKNPIAIYSDYVPNANNPGTGSYKVYKISIPVFIPGISYILKF